MLPNSATNHHFPFQCLNLDATTQSSGILINQAKKDAFMWKRHNDDDDNDDNDNDNDDDNDDDEVDDKDDEEDDNKHEWERDMGGSCQWLSCGSFVRGFFYSSITQPVAWCNLGSMQCRIDVFRQLGKWLASIWWKLISLLSSIGGSTIDSARYPSLLIMTAEQSVYLRALSQTDS